jgi:ABC-type glycerol-3-phosphate transport system substrate-binding protein
MWEGGNAMFMRNWPTYIVDSNKDTSKVQQKFGIMTLPYGDGDKGRIGRSCIGGWGLAINAFTPQEKREAAWKFIHWMLQEDIQVFAAIDAVFIATRLSVYDNSYSKEQNPFYSKIIDMINHYSQARPQLANYQPFSSAIQASIYQILTEPSPDIHGSLNTLQETLQGIIDKGKRVTNSHPLGPRSIPPKGLSQWLVRNLMVSRCIICENLWLCIEVERDVFNIGLKGN